MNKLTTGIAVAVVIVVLAVLVGGNNNQPGATFSGTTSSFLDAKQGFRVNGTTVIDSSGNVDAPITSSTGTFSSTLAVTATTTLSSSLTLNQATACINLYATSTATRISLVFPTTGATSTYNGTVYFQYGSCQGL